MRRRLLLIVGVTWAVASSRLLAQPVGAAFGPSRGVGVPVVSTGVLTSLLSYTTNPQTNGFMQVTIAYTSSLPTTPSATWSGGGGTFALIGWQTILTGVAEGVIPTPTSATGSLTLTIGSLAPVTVTMAAAALDLAPGLYLPPTLFWGQGAINNTALGSYVTRGMVGNPTVTIGGPDASKFILNTTTKQILNGNGLDGDTSVTSFNFSLTATDGINTFTKSCVVSNPVSSTPIITIDSNVVLDSSPLQSFGYLVCDVSAWQDVVSVSLNDPAGVLVFDNVLAVVYVPAAKINMYGSYPVTFTVVGPSTTFMCSTTFYICHQRPPTVSWRPDFLVFNNTPAGIIGTADYYDDGVIQNSPLLPGVGDGNIIAKVPTNPSPGCYIGWTGPVTLAGTPAAGALNFVFSVQGNAGTTDLFVNLNVGVGTTLSSGNITNSTIPTLYNDSCNLPLPWDGATSSPNAPNNPILVTTLAVSGFTNTPTWSIKVAWSDGKPSSAQGQSIQAYANVVAPRYTFNAPNYIWNNNPGGFTPQGAATWTDYQLTATGTSGITLYANYLSTQTDLVTLTADDGLGTRCSVTLSVVVNARVGPNVDVGPGQTFTTFNDFMNAWWPAQSTYNGAVVTLHPGIDAATDFTVSHGVPAWSGWMPGPCTLQSPAGTVRTDLDWLFGNNGSSQAGLVGANFDLTLINLQIRNVSNTSSAPNAGAVYMTAQTPGNLTIIGCNIWNCDMGVMNGDGSPRKVILTDCIFQRNGSHSDFSHSIYANTIGRLEATRCQIDCAFGDHGLKNRGAITIVTDCKIRQGAQALYTGSPIDTPLGGDVTITNTIIEGGTASNTQNNAIMWAPCAEAGPPDPIWPGSSNTISGCTFYGMALPAAGGSGPGSYGPLVGINNNISVCPTDGSPVPTIYTSNQFYNMSAANWVIVGFSGFPTYYSSAIPAVDGGGNVTLTTYTHQTVIDFLTGIEPINPPLVAFAIPIDAAVGLPALMDPDSFRLDFVIATAPSIGTTVFSPTAYDAIGNALTGTVTYTMLNSDGSKFAFSGNAVQTAASLADGAYWVQMEATGTGVPTSGGSPVTMTTVPQWTTIMVGNGFVAAS